MSMMLNSYFHNGGGPVPFTGFRSSNITATSGTSATITLPTGATAGDQLWLFRECTNANNATSGFTTHSNLTGTFCNGMAEYKTLTAGDISTGSVSITMASGAGAGVVWAVCLNGVPGTIVTTNAADFLRNSGGGASTRSVTTVESWNAGDFAMLFAAQRDSAASAPTCNQGSVDKTKTGAPASSGYLISSGAGGANLSATWTFGHTIDNGSYVGIVIVRA